jgi:hypothetical protein
VVPGFDDARSVFAKCAVDLPRRSCASALQNNGPAGNTWCLLLLLLYFPSFLCSLSQDSIGEISKTECSNTNHESISTAPLHCETLPRATIPETFHFLASILHRSCSSTRPHRSLQTETSLKGHTHICDRKSFMQRILLQYIIHPVLRLSILQLIHIICLRRKLHIFWSRNDTELLCVVERSTVETNNSLSRSRL